VRRNEYRPGLALALQDTLKTFIAGITLGHIVRLGEWIAFEGKEGMVTDINWARTTIQTVEGLLGALAGAAYVPAVNLPFRGPKDAEGAAGWMRLAERSAHFLCALSAGRMTRLAVETWGLPEDLLRPVAVAAAKGALEANTPEVVNYVNAMHVAGERGLSVSETRHEEPGHFARSIRVSLESAGVRSRVHATLFAGREARVVEVDDRPLEFRPEGTVVFLRNRDVPGVIGKVGTILGEGGINISRFHLGRRERGGEAMAVIEVDFATDAETLDALRSLPEILSVRVIELV